MLTAYFAMQKRPSSLRAAPPLVALALLALFGCGTTDAAAPQTGTTSTDTSLDAGTLADSAATSDAAPDTAPDTAPATDTAPDTAPALDTAPDTAPATDTAPDTAPATASDTAPDTTIAPWHEVLHGTWLIGWSGGMNHFSWVRISTDAGAQGVALYNAGANLSVNAPYWPCTGKGSWDLVSKPNAFRLTLPAGCTIKSLVVTLVDPQPPKQGSWPKGPILWSTAEIYHPDTGTTQKSMGAYKYADSVCDATLSTCTGPLL